MQIQHTFGFSLSQISIGHRNSLERLMNAIGLHYSQISILNALWDDDGQSQAELVRTLKVSAPTVNKMINSLAKSNFVQCKKCKKDSRMVRVFLTKKGKEIRSQVRDQWQILEEIILQDFSETEKMLFSLLLEKLKKNLIK
jgi:MarR family transcriptional regulator, organic hydroperoxide resistance regulator